MNLDPTSGYQRRLSRLSLIVVAGSSAAGLALHSPAAGLSLALGGLISWVNLRWLGQAVDFVVAEGGIRAINIHVTIRYIIRYVLIGLAVYSTMKLAFLDLAFVLVGLLACVLAVLVECALEVGRVLIRE